MGRSPMDGPVLALRARWRSGREAGGGLGAPSAPPAGPSVAWNQDSTN